MIIFEDFTFYYPETVKPALENINTKIEDGEFVLISGPSSCGKTSLCRCLNGLIPHFYGGTIKGKVNVEGFDVLKTSTRKLALKVGFVSQDPENQLVALNVEDEIAFGLENFGFPKSLIAKRIEESLNAVGAEELRLKNIYELSGGEKQKIAIASVLALQPKILVLDEPTSQLDPKSSEDILALIEKLNDELGITIILVEHRLERVLHHADRLILMLDGRIVADGKPREVMSKHNLEEFYDLFPPVVKLVKKLKKRGFNFNNYPLTVKELRISLNNELKKLRFKKLNKNPEKQSEYSYFNSKRVAIEVKNLSYTYPNGFRALKNINLKIFEGEFVAIMGRNSSGKTTLVKHFSGLLKPSKGEVYVYGVNVEKIPTAKLSEIVGFVFQNPSDHLFAETVEEEIMFGLKNLNLPEDEIKRRVNYVLKVFGLEGKEKVYPRFLSGGEKQRVALASIIALQPKILVLDEPTRGMDYKLKVELMKYLDSYRKNGNTIILVTHDVEVVAEYADRVVLMGDGKVIVDGFKREILSKALFFSPQMNRLAQAYEEYGFPPNVLTVEEFVKVLGV